MVYDFRNNKGWGRQTTNSAYALTQAVSSDDFPEFISEVLEAGVRTAFLDELVGRELCTFERMASPIASWLREDGFDAGFIGEMEEPPTASIRHSKFTVRPIKIGMALQYSQELVEDTELDVVGAHVNKVGRAIARAEDRYVMWNLLNMVADGTSDYKSGDYVSNHVLNGSDADWTVSGGDLTHEKLATAIYVMEKEGYNVDAVVMSPAQRAQLNLLEQFYGGNKWSDMPQEGINALTDASIKADLGIPRGAQLVVSNTMPDDEVLMLNRSEFAKFWERRPLTVTQQPKTPNELFHTAFAERVACAVVEPAAAVKITNLGYIDPSALAV
jgi:HK97 family phage major capsid protein